MTKKIDDQSNAKDDAALPRRTYRRNIEAERRREQVAGFEVGNDPNRPAHPDGWQTGGR